jgi:hypothetical protein
MITTSDRMDGAHGKSGLVLYSIARENMRMILLRKEDGDKDARPVGLGETA